MDLKKYYLRNELAWHNLTEDQIISLQENGYVESNGKKIGFAPRIAMFKSEGGFVEMYEISPESVFINSILDGITMSSGEVGKTVGMTTFTMPVNVLYVVRAVVSQTNYYFNNRFFPNIEDAIEYYNKIKTFVIEKQEDLKQLNESKKALEDDGKE